MAGAAGADLHDGCALRALPAESFLEAAAPAAPVEIVARGAAVRCDRNRVDGADLRGFGIDRIEKRQDILLERIGDVRAGKPRRLDRIEKLRQSTLLLAIDVHQMIEAIDAGRGERFGEECRRQRTHDVRADKPEQHPALAHATRSGWARPPPRNSCAMRGSARIFGAVSSMRVWPCSSTRP